MNGVLYIPHPSSFRRAGQSAWRLLSILPLLTCCSCQSLPNIDVARRDRPAPREALASTESAAPRASALIGERNRSHDQSVDAEIALVSHSKSLGGGYCGHGIAGGACRYCNPTAAGLPDSAFVGFGPLPPALARLEYICNGDDSPPPVIVKSDWTVHGLHAGDAVAHYDTLSGDVEVSPATEVCIYAPRFAAVRKVSAAIIHEQHERGVGVDQPTGPAQSNETQIATTAVQPLQAGRHLAVHMPQRIREKSRGAGLDNRQSLAGADAALLPYEDFLLIRRGQFDVNEKARLAIRLSAAYVWTHDLGLQVVIDNEQAVAAVTDRAAQSVFRYELPEGKPRLRLAKVASAETAQVGDIIDFTIRFDNIGDERVGNVTVVDHLVTRLEYVPDSQECSVKAEFFTQDSASESLTLRWEIQEPLEVGEGGVIRFQCLVR